MRSILRRARRRIALAMLAATTLALPLAAAQPAPAGSYWWTGTPAAGSNGFSYSSADQPYWNPWAGARARCESRGTTIPAGNPCILAWHVPTGLDALGGSISGTYKHANAAFEQHNVVECNGTTVLQGTATITSFTRSWADMCGYLSIGLVTPLAPATVAAASQFFEATSFTINLVDSSDPRLTRLTGHEGWHGSGGACIRYGFSEFGSGLVATMLSNITNGRIIDSASFDNGGIVTGVTSTDRTPCMAAPGTGTYRLRATATDKSGNVALHDVTISFDVTPPAIGAPTIDGAPLADELELRGSVGGYRPTFAIPASDGHAGLASTEVLLDGVRVSSGASWTPASDLEPGAHTVTFRAVDGAGNAATASRRFHVVDDVAPVLERTSPAASGGSEPVLDIAARDDLSGLEPTSWTVTVNGRVLVASSTSWRLLADVGYLVDGTHHVRVSITDRAGNVAVDTFDYVADSGDGEPDAPGLTGLYLMQSPDRVEEGSTYHVRAIAVDAGRPVAGRFELRAGDRVLAAADAARSGQVDLDATIDVAGPLVLHPPSGSTLDPVELRYEFVPAPLDPCVAAPLSAACTGTAGGTDGSAGGSGSNGSSSPTIITVPVPAAIPAPAASAAGGGASLPVGYPRDVVYFVHGRPYWNGLPLAESGAKGDKVPPRWRMTLRRERAGSVRRHRRIAIRLWTNEMTVLSITPAGSRRVFSVNPRRRTRTIHVRFDRRSALGRRFARTRPGQVVSVRLRVVATDKNENRAWPRTIVMRVRA